LRSGQQTMGILIPESINTLGRGGARVLKQMYRGLRNELTFIGGD
jgi:hypothetical protein